MSNLQLNLTQTLGLFSRKITASSNGVPFSKPKSGGIVVLDIPLEKIRRPLMRTRENDQEKVKVLMESIRDIGLQEPIDVLEVEGIYYGVSQCLGHLRSSNVCRHRVWDKKETRENGRSQNGARLPRSANGRHSGTRAVPEQRPKQTLKHPLVRTFFLFAGFSGCHRFEAHQRLGLPTIRCKIRRGTKETLRHHMR